MSDSENEMNLYTPLSSLSKKKDNTKTKKRSNDEGGSSPNLNNSKHHTFDEISTIMKELQINVLNNKILPYNSYFQQELSNSIVLDDISIQLIQSHIFKNPLQFFTLSNGDIVPITNPTNNCFIFFANQIFYYKHFMSEPLFNLAFNFEKMTKQEVKDLTFTFIKNLRQFPYTYIQYKDFTIKVNKQHLTSAVEDLLKTPLRIDNLIVILFTFLYTFFKQADPEIYHSNQEMAMFLLKIKDHVNPCVPKLH